MGGVLFVAPLYHFGPCLEISFCAQVGLKRGTGEQFVTSTKKSACVKN